MTTPYQINFTDSINKGFITVEDNTINTETSLGLPGRDVQSYGETVNENFLHLLENFANNDSPSNPIEGQLWYDTTTGIDQLKIYDGTNWVSASGVKKGPIAPEISLSVLGDLWVNTSTQQVYIFTGSGWLLVGPEYSEGVSTGTKYQSIVSSDNQLIPVVVNYVNGQAIMIVSSTEFVPKSTISGFSKIYVGTNLSTNVGGYPGKYRGISEKAENLVYGSTIIPAESVVRRDVENVITKPLRIRSNIGLDIGESQTLLFQVEGSVGVISHKATGSNLDIRVNDAGTTRTAIRIMSNGKIGINNLAPTESLDVTGNIKTSGKIYSNSTDNSLSIGTGALVLLGGAGIAQDVYIGGTLSVNNSVSTTNILPKVNNTYNIGNTSFNYNSVYATNFYGNLTGNITGNVSGAAGSAAKLNSGTTFQMSGDVSSPSFVFDGQLGGVTKTFTTIIDPTFLSNKTELYSIASTDEILINRPGTGLVKVKQGLLVSTVPTTPIGAMMQYGGKTAPAGWFICDGSEVSLSTYAALATALGYDITNLASWGWGLTGSPSSTFKLPDFRGRFPLGYLGTASTGNRVNDAAANTIGNYGGVESRYITKDMLPEHQHSLVGDTGTQYNAVSTNTSATDSNSAPFVGVGDGIGRGLQITSGVDGVNHTTQTINGSQQEVGNAFNMVNPFGTVNFIIYHGVV
jgi:microcystin-dependent protein